MYEDFVATDRWTSEKLHCVWKGTVVAIATRHADATDIRFAVNGKPLMDRDAEPGVGGAEAPQWQGDYRLSGGAGGGALFEAGDRERIRQRS